MEINQRILWGKEALNVYKSLMFLMQHEHKLAFVSEVAPGELELVINDCFTTLSEMNAKFFAMTSSQRLVICSIEQLLEIKANDSDIIWWPTHFESERETWVWLFVEEAKERVVREQKEASIKNQLETLSA